MKGNYMLYFNIFDLLSLFILIILAFLIYFRRLLRFNINMYFFYHVIVAIFAVIFSMAITFVTKEFAEPNPILIYTLSALYVFVITSTFTLGYVICRSIADEDIKRRPYFIPIFTTAMCAVLLIVVPFIDQSDVMLGILLSYNHLYYLVIAVQTVNLVLSAYYMIRYYKKFNIYMLSIGVLAYIFLIVWFVIYSYTKNLQLINFLISIYLSLSYFILLSSANQFDKDISLISDKKVNKMIIKAIVENKFTFVLGPTYSNHLGKFVGAESDLGLVDKNFGPISSSKIREIATSEGYIYRIEKIDIINALNYILRNPDMMKEIGWIVIHLSNSTLEAPNRIGNLMQMVISKKVPTRQIAFKIELETDENKIELAKLSTHRLNSMGFKVMFDFVHSPNRSFKVLVQHSDSYIIINNEILERLYSKDEGEVSSDLIKYFVEVLGLKFIVSYISDENQKNAACNHDINLMSGDFFCQNLHEKQFNEFVRLNNKVGE